MFITTFTYILNFYKINLSVYLFIKKYFFLKARYDIYDLSSILKYLEKLFTI